jgi:hypothetical protein
MRCRLLTIFATRFGEMPMAFTVHFAKARIRRGFFLEHFSRGDWCEYILSHRRLQSVIVNNLNRVRLAIEPFENDPPLIIDTNCLEVAEVALQLLTYARRCALFTLVGIAGLRARI